MKSSIILIFLLLPLIIKCQAADFLSTPKTRHYVLERIVFKYKAAWKDQRKTEIEEFLLEQYGYPGEGFNFVLSPEADLF